MSIDNNSENWQPKIVAFTCNWCAYAGADLAGLNRLSYPPDVRLVRVPCASRMNPQFVLRAFEKGADAVLVSGWHPGECHYVSGNYFARRRYLLMTKLLEFVGIEPERFKVRWVAGSEANRFVDVCTQMSEEVRALGPNRKLRDLV